MNEEDDIYTDEIRAKNAGFIDFDHFARYRIHAARGLLYYGDSFGRALGWSLMEATIDNAIKIFRYWQDLCQQHAILYQMRVAKQKALHDEQVNDQ